MKTKFWLLFLLLVIVPVVIGFALAGVGYFPAINPLGGSPAATGTTVFVYPSQVKDDTLQAGSAFTVYVNVSDVSDLFAWQVNMTWNPSILNITTITFGNFLAAQPEGTSRISPNPMWNVNNNKGYALFGETTLGNYPGVSGNGCLASIEFLVLDYGETVLNIEISAQPSNTVLLDQMLQNITFTPENGYFSNSARALVPKGVQTWYWEDNTEINSVAVDDVDNDGQTELVTGGYYHDGMRPNAQLAVWNGSTLTLEMAKDWYWAGETRINSVAVGDVDVDGSVELVTGGYYNDLTRRVAQLCVWDSTPSLEGVTTWHWGDDTVINSVAMGDVDDDPQVEIVTGGYYHDGTRDVAQLAVWDGSTLTLEDVTTWYWVGDTPIRSVAIGDIDADGEEEIVTGGYHHDGTRTNALLAVWNGTLSLEAVTTWYWVGDTRIYSVACADVDGDGQIEIVTGGGYWDGTRLVAQLCVWTGSTLSLEGVKTWYWTGDTFVNSVAVADVDGDLSMEIVTGGYYHDGTRLNAQLAIWNGATLAFEEATGWHWVGATIINSVTVGDVDVDGSVEIVTGGYYDDLTRHWAQLAVWIMA